jgi:serine phosphatase RsbU (regulator of sigma subunit)
MEHGARPASLNASNPRPARRRQGALRTTHPHSACKARKCGNERRGAACSVRTDGVAATAPFSDDPCRLLSWANAALIERAGISSEFVTAACVTYLPGEQCLRWAYAGHPRALWLDDGRELIAPSQGTPLGIGADPGSVEGSLRATAGAGVLLYTDGLTEARHDDQLFGPTAP